MKYSFPLWNIARLKLARMSPELFIVTSWNLFSSVWKFLIVYTILPAAKQGGDWKPVILSPIDLWGYFLLKDLTPSKKIHLPL